VSFAKAAMWRAPHEKNSSGSAPTTQKVEPTAPAGVVRLSRGHVGIKLLAPDGLVKATPDVSPVGAYGHSYEDGVETIWKIAAPKSRIIEGIASTPTVNSHGYSLSSKGCLIRLPAPLLFSHGFINDERKQASRDHSEMKIGEIFYARKSTSQIFIKAHVFHNEAGDYAWKLIESGEARCFSGAAAGKSLRLSGVVAHHRFFAQWELSEVSVCPQGANPDCIVTAVRP